MGKGDSVLKKRVLLRSKATRMLGNFFISERVIIIIIVGESIDSE